MGKYNKSQILKNAWRTYKYVGKKKGQTFGEVLKSTWRLAKIHVSMEEAASEAKAKRDAEYNQWLESKKNEVKKVSYSNYSYEDLYGTFQHGRYVGD